MDRWLGLASNDPCGAGACGTPCGGMPLQHFVPMDPFFGWQQPLVPGPTVVPQLACAPTADGQLCFVMLPPCVPSGIGGGLAYEKMSATGGNAGSMAAGAVSRGGGDAAAGPSPRNKASWQASNSASRRRRRQRATIHARAKEKDEGHGQDAQASVAEPPLAWARGGLEARCKRWAAQLDAGGVERAAALAELAGVTRRLTFEAAGCRVVQLALQVAGPREAAPLAAELHGYVRRAVASPHGNYVVQKIISELPTNLTAFVAQELIGVAAEVARHRYGCRILCRLVEHAAAEVGTAALLEELLRATGDLSRHNFGHHVIQSILEHGLPEQQRAVAEALVHQLPRNVRSRNATYVLEKVLTYCQRDQQDALVRALVENPEELLAMAESQVGFHVVRALLRLPLESSQLARELLQRSAPRLQSGRFGSRVLDEFQVRPAAAAAA